MCSSVVSAVLNSSWRWLALVAASHCGMCRAPQRCTSCRCWLIAGLFALQNQATALRVVEFVVRVVALMQHIAFIRFGTYRTLGNRLGSTAVVSVSPLCVGSAVHARTDEADPRRLSSIVLQLADHDRFESVPRYDLVTTEHMYDVLRTSMLQVLHCCDWGYLVRRLLHAAKPVARYLPFSSPAKADSLSDGCPNCSGTPVMPVKLQPCGHVLCYMCWWAQLNESGRCVAASVWPRRFRHALTHFVCMQSTLPGLRDGSYKR